MTIIYGWLLLKKGSQNLRGQNMTHASLTLGFGPLPVNEFLGGKPIYYISQVKNGYMMNRIISDSHGHWSFVQEWFR